MQYSTLKAQAQRLRNEHGAIQHDSPRTNSRSTRCALTKGSSLWLFVCLFVLTMLLDCCGIVITPNEPPYSY